MKLRLPTGQHRKQPRLVMLVDVASQATGVDGTLAANTCLDGIIGSQLRHMAAAPH
jgi:hypothetical protein